MGLPSDLADCREFIDMVYKLWKGNRKYNRFPIFVCIAGDGKDSASLTIPNGEGKKEPSDVILQHRNLQIKIERELGFSEKEIEESRKLELSKLNLGFI